jgi:hypothetical protein
MKNIGIVGALLMSLTLASGNIGCTEVQAAEPKAKLFMDVHELGKVTAADVAAAHAKDLAAQKKHGVSFKTYWVDEVNGRVYCLSEARSAEDVIATHKEAHGLVPTTIAEVTEGH